MQPVLMTIVKSEIERDRAMQRTVNDYARDAMRMAGQYWIKEYLPLHFKPQAVRRYGYAKRSHVRNRIKRRAERVKISKYGKATVVMRKPASPLIWTGELVDDVLQRPLMSFNINATATSNKIKVVVKVKIPHPLNPKNKGEITRLINPEVKAMQKVAIAKFRSLMKRRRKQITERIGAR